MKKKLLLSFLAIFILFGIISQPVIFGYNLQYKVKANLDASGDIEDYIFKTYTTAAVGTVSAFPRKSGTMIDDSLFGPIKWVDSSGSSVPTVGTFVTTNLRFHKFQIGKYGSQVYAAGYYGYTVGQISKQNSVLPEPIGTSSSFSSAAKLSWDEDLLKSKTNNYYEAPTAQEKRMTLLAVKSTWPNKYKPYVNASNPAGANDEKIYVSDKYITTTQLKNKIIPNLSYAVSYGKYTYVSDVTQTYYQGVYKKHYSAKSLLYNTQRWGGATENVADWPGGIGDPSLKGQVTSDTYRLGSAINLYDNILILPQTGVRTVLVRHMDLGTGKIISTHTVSSATRLAANDKATKIFANGNEENIDSLSSISGHGEYSEYNEMYGGSSNNLLGDEGIKINVKDINNYDCIGYNKSIATTFAVAIADRTTKIANRSKVALGEEDKVTVVANTTSSYTDDYVLIDLYYSKQKAESKPEDDDIILPDIEATPPIQRRVLARYIDLGTDKPITAAVVSASNKLNKSVAGAKLNGLPSTIDNAAYPDFQGVWLVVGGSVQTIEAVNVAGYVYKGYIHGSAININKVASYNAALGTRNTKISGNSITPNTKIFTLPALIDPNQPYGYNIIDFYYYKTPLTPAPGLNDINHTPALELTGKILYGKVGNYEFQTVTGNGAAIVLPGGGRIKTGLDSTYKFLISDMTLHPKPESQTTTYTLTQSITVGRNFDYVVYHEIKDDLCPTSIDDWSKPLREDPADPTKITGYEQIYFYNCFDPVTGEYTVTRHTGYTSVPNMANKTYTYKVPVWNTYYTVPNLKVLTINKLDIYNQQGTAGTSGLPFLYKASYIDDDIDYVLYPKPLAATKNVIDAGYGQTGNIEPVSDVKTITIAGSYADAANLGWSYADAKLDAENNIKANYLVQASGALDTPAARASGKSIDIEVHNQYVGINTLVINPATSVKHNVPLRDFNDTGYIGTWEKVITDFGKKYIELTVPEPNPDSIAYSTEKTTIDDWLDNVFEIPESRFNGERFIAGKVTYTPNASLSIVEAGDTLTDIEKTKLYKKPLNPVALEQSDVQPGIVFTPVAIATKVIPTINPPFVDHRILNEDIDTTVTILNDSEFKINCIPAIHKAVQYYEGDVTTIGTNKYTKNYYVKFDFDVKNVKVSNSLGVAVLYNKGKIVTKDTWIGPVSKVTANSGWGYVKAQPAESPKPFVRNKATVLTVAKNIPSPLDVPGDLEEDVISEDKFPVMDPNHGGDSSTTPYKKDHFIKSNWITHYIIPGCGPALIDISNNTYIDNWVENINPEALMLRYHGRKDILKIGWYLAEIETSINRIEVGRIFDFKITDLKDINWKNVFRKTSNSSASAHTGNVYYSGTMKWNYNSLIYNDMISRTSGEIGKTPKRILPLGPYKNTNMAYTKAPKMGYRFSFDLKTTGKIIDPSSTTASIKIKPSFYYISKDGTKFYNESLIANKKIKLFYKNSTGKYVEVGSAQDSYKLSFIPNDGYRYVDKNMIEYDNSNMSKSSVELGDLKKTGLTLTNKMMAISNMTIGDQDSIQTWYGEYKLPNSTIAVVVTRDPLTLKETYDINKPLTGGYIGVVFDIVANVTGTELEYSTNDENHTPTPITNTSEWDYEAYMGWTKHGSTYTNGSIKTKLEKGTWAITSAQYPLVKGTVILYDTDNRAANDFE